MAFSTAHQSLLLLVVVAFAPAFISSSRTVTDLVQTPSSLVTYHNGPLLQRDISISIIWYGKFTPVQKSILLNFLFSLTHSSTNPSVSTWWGTLEKHYIGKSRILIASQLSDESCSIGKNLKREDIPKLAVKAGQNQGRCGGGPIYGSRLGPLKLWDGPGQNKGGVALVLTAEDVGVEGFCMSSCGSHGSHAQTKSAYVWVGNSATQCPGQCAWPFHQPIYGPQGPALVAPNGDVGVDGMVINLASMVAGAVTNPFGSGYYQGPAVAPLEAATTCAGIYGKGAYPGYAGELLIDPSTGASYNANGLNSRKYLLPALYNPSTASCATLV